MAEPAPNAIGGYFGLELPVGREPWHRGALAVNSGRNALRCLLEAVRPSRVHLPVFTCEAVPATVAALGIPASFYRIDEAFEPRLDAAAGVDDGAVVLYTNYFGLKSRCAQALAARGVRLILDNAQAYFAPPVGTVGSFCSPRKFFGVPDGGYAHGPAVPPATRDASSARAEHLLLRHDVSAQAGYAAYQANERRLVDLPPMAMSGLTERLLASIDHAAVIDQRRRNFRQLHEALRSSNALCLDVDDEAVPLSYPYLGRDPALRERLQAQNVFTACYWPDVLRSAAPASLEHHYASRIVHLPVDQRYGAADMQRVLSLTLS
jgi:hypothetical protein